MSVRLIPFARGLLAIPVVLGVSALARGADDDRPPIPVEVQEWSVWVGSPEQTSLNTARVYLNGMPGPVGTTRPKIDEKDKAERFPVAPVSIVRFFGEPTHDVDVELQVKSGTMLAHWPPAKERSGRLQWFGSDLTASPPADLPPSYLPPAHWFHQLRESGPALFLRSGNSVERFLAYDVELPRAVPLRLRGGPDVYTLQNLTGHPLLDVVLVAPTKDGFRVGWLDELPSAVPDDGKAEAEAKKEEEDKARKMTDREKAEAIFEEAEKPSEDEEEPIPPLPKEGDATLLARMDQVLNRPVTLNVEKAPLREVLDLIASQARFRYELDDRSLKKAEIDPAQPVHLQAANLAARDALAEVLGNAGLSYRVSERGLLFITTAERLSEALEKKDLVLEGPPVSLTLSQPLPASDPSYRELTRDAYTRRLMAQGLRDDLVRSLIDHYGPLLFEPGELIVVAHEPREAIDEAVFLDVFPPPKSLVRVAAVVMHGIDPRLQDQARELVGQLGDESPRARDAAEARLFSLGPVAVPALEDALTSKDTEVVFRAERLLMRLHRNVP